MLPDPMDAVTTLLEGLTAQEAAAAQAADALAALDRQLSVTDHAGHWQSRQSASGRRLPGELASP